MRNFCLILILSCLSFTLKAQLTGIRTIPGTYSSIALAVADLNSQGVGTGGVTFNVAAGYTETITARINLTATGTAANPIIFQKSGAGANPLITAYANTGGTATAISSTPDGIWSLTGSDYVTINGINLAENAANTTAGPCMEYGYGIFKQSGSNGAGNNTIRNCTITLNRANNSTAGGPMYSGSVGILLINAHPTSADISINVAGFNGVNSNNRFYANTIQNVNAGIVLSGFGDVTPFNFSDTNNDVGGNSPATGNTIRNYGGGSGSTNPAAGIFTSHQRGVNIGYNTVNSNDGGGINHPTTLRGIHLTGAASSTFSVNNNTVTVRSAGSVHQLTGIDMEAGGSAGGNTVTISNNSVVNCTYTSATNGTFQAIRTNASAANILISSNTVDNNSLGGTGQLDCIVVATSPINAVVQDNIITNNSKTAIGLLIGISHTGSASNITYSGNIIAGNQILGPSGTMRCMQVGFSNYTVTNNNVNNNSIPNANNVVSSNIYGLFGSSSARGELISGNTIHSLSLGGPNASGSNQIAGIFIPGSSGTTKNVFNNTIHNLVYNATGTGKVNIYGIHHGADVASNIYKNKIYNLTATTGTSSLVRGINLLNTSSYSVHNNYIGHLNAPASDLGDAVQGIAIAGSALPFNTDISFNTIYLNATGTASGFGTAGIYHTHNATAAFGELTMRGNIVVNLSNAVGTGRTAAFERSAATDLNNYNPASNNNLFYAGPPSATRLIYYDGTNSDQTLAAFKARVSPRESASATEAVNFLSITGSDPDYLHINPATATQVEKGALPLAGITDDFDGDLRNAANPDMGADEFNGIALDLAPPIITYTPFIATCITGDRVLSGVTITDATGVPVSGGLVPRIYFKKNAGGPWFSAAGSLLTGSGTNGTWSFTISAATMGGLAPGNQVFYYVIAQDIAPSSNIGSNSGALVAASVNTVTTHPASPNVFNVNGILNGTYTVGAGGNYPTLTAAVADYNLKCLSGPVVFELIDGTYGGAETYPITIRSNLYASAVNTLTIRPAAGNNATIASATATGSSLIRFAGAKYVIIDGLNSGGSSLRIENTSGSGIINTAAVWISSLGTGAGSTHITIRNTGIKGNSNASVPGFGIYAGGATISETGTGDDNDNLTIQNNTIARAYYAIYAQASGTGVNDNLNILGNSIGGNTAADYISFRGISLAGANNADLSGNTIFNIISGQDDQIAIELDNNISNTVISKNTIREISQTGVPQNAGRGIVQNLNAFNLTISNNMISGLKGKGVIGSNQNSWGIILTSGSNVKLYYNSIHIPDNRISTGVTDISGGIYITSGMDGVEMKNNLISLTGAPGNASGRMYCVYAVSSASLGSLNHNNYHVAGTQNQVGYVDGLARVTLANWRAALIGEELNSVSIAPVFVSATDLRLQLALNGTLNNLGTPVAGITTDIDNENRNPATPDMGADEIAISTGADMQATDLVAPIQKNCYSTPQTVIVRVKNASVNPINFATSPTTVTTTVSGAGSAVLSATINTGTLAAGAIRDVTMTGTLDMTAWGTYTFNATTAVTGDQNTGNDAMTPVNLNSITPNGGFAVSNLYAFCGSGGTPQLSMSFYAGIDSIQWQESTVSNSGPWTNVGVVNSPAYTPVSPISVTTWYQAQVYCGLTTTWTNTVTVAVNNPQIIATAPNSRCGPGTVVLGATPSAGAQINWYAAASGGEPLATGNTYTTPSIPASTNYYAAAGTGVGVGGIAPITPADFGTPSSSTATIGSQYMTFDVLQASITFLSVKVYPTAAIGSSFSIVIQNSSGTQIFTTGVLSTTVTGGNTPQTVILNANIPFGTNYRIGMGINPGMQRNTTGAVYPNGGPGVLFFTGNNVNPAFWYYLYELRFKMGCEGPRMLVPATVNTPGTLLAGTAGGPQLCQTVSIPGGGQTFVAPSCGLIGRVVPNGAFPVTGNVNACVKIDATVQVYNSMPYLQRHFDIEPATNAATATGRVTLYVLQSEFNTYNAANGIYPDLPTGPADVAGIGNIRVTQYHGTGTAPGNYTGMAELINPADADIIWNATDSRWEISFNVNGFSGFYIHSPTGAALPVELVFSGEKEGSSNLLRWTTGNEQNNRGFEIEYSTDGTRFRPIGFLPSQAAGGNSSTPLAYRYYHHQPAGEQQYYRLRQLDLNGQSRLSRVLRIRGEKPNVLTLSEPFPNPAGNRVQLYIDAPRRERVNIIVTDMAGKIVKQQAAGIEAGSNTIELNTAQLASGAYLIKLVCESNCGALVRRLVKKD